jgi:hypothetical protein
MGKRYLTPSEHSIPAQPVPPAPARDNSRTIALLEQWTREDATNDPATVAEAERKLAEFKAAFNANRPPDISRSFRES